MRQVLDWKKQGEQASSMISRGLHSSRSRTEVMGENWEVKLADSKRQGRRSDAEPIRDIVTFFLQIHVTNPAGI